MKNSELDTSREKIPVSAMAEYVGPVTTLVDMEGKHHSFRKFLWMGHWGLCDGDAKDVVVPAKSSYQQIDIFFYSQLLVAGSKINGWDIYNLSGEKIDEYPAMDLTQLKTLIN